MNSGTARVEFVLNVAWFQEGNALAVNVQLLQY